MMDVMVVMGGMKTKHEQPPLSLLFRLVLRMDYCGVARLAWEEEQRSRSNDSFY